MEPTARVGHDHRGECGGVVGGLAKHERLVALLLQGLLAEVKPAGGLAVEEAAGPATQRVMAVMGEDAVVGVLDLDDAAERVVDDMALLIAPASAVAVVEQRRVLDAGRRMVRTLLVSQHRLAA